MLTGGGLPSSGGVKPRIVLTIPASSLTNRTGAARLADGTQISPTLARLLACDADLVPVTLDGDGNPLDVGRTRRLFTGPVRTALEVRDRGCAWPGCDRPVSWTQAHHIVSWQDGGKTSLDNGVLLCLFHHHEIETADWTVAIHRGRAAFTPPTWIDPDRKPRINPMHHPPPRDETKPLSWCRLTQFRACPGRGNRPTRATRRLTTGDLPNSVAALVTVDIGRNLSLPGAVGELDVDMDVRHSVRDCGTEINVDDGNGVVVVTLKHPVFDPHALTLCHDRRHPDELQSSVDDRPHRAVLPHACEPVPLAFVEPMAVVGHQSTDRGLRLQPFYPSDQRHRPF